MFLVNADDFGMSLGVNEAIFDLILTGTINSCSIMCNMPYTQDAINKIRILLNRNIKFNINLHFNITEGCSLNKNTIYTIDNIYIKDTDVILKELLQQAEFLKDNGIVFQGIDCHHNVNLKNDIVDNIIKQQFNVRVRDYRVYKKLYGNSEDIILAKGLCSKEYNEIMVHPASFIDNYLSNCTTYCKERIDEYKLLKKNADLIKLMVKRRNAG